MRVDVEDCGDPKKLGRGLYHGNTLHGFQFEGSEFRNTPTTYYSEESGLALAIKVLCRDSKIRAGIVGLGTGTSAAYGRDGDYLRFYEINPDVIRLATETFTFLKDSPAEINISRSDARLAMECESNQNYDLIVLDAFSSDAVPTHLLTLEAFDVYRKHLSDNGIIAVHISNRHLDLLPVVAGSAVHLGLELVQIETDFEGSMFPHEASSNWVILTANEQFLKDREVCSLSTDTGGIKASAIEWTDQCCNLLEVLK